MRLAAAVVPCVLLAATACRSLDVTPRALRGSGGRPADRAAAVERWDEAVRIMNEFLASPYRSTLPRGRFELTEDGMAFTTDAGCAWPVAVRSTTWGDLVVATGFRAQESEDGFCVGGTGAQEGEAADPLLDNTFFRQGDGSWYGAAALAELTLHETTHEVYGAGTVGPWNTVWYYAVAAATLRSSTHPAEDRPRATSAEFAWFRLARDPQFAEYVDAIRSEHLATPHAHCEHGPFPEPPCPCPVSSGRTAPPCESVRRGRAAAHRPAW